MEAIAYIRWSTEDQSRGDSETRQSRLAHSICDTKGWTLTEEVIESGKSAFHGKHRVGAGKMLQLEQRAARGELSGKALLVENLDRMSRQEPLEGLNLLTSFTKQGVTVVETVTGETWTADKIASHWTTLLTAFIRAGLAYEESKKKSLRIRSAWQTTQSGLRTNDGKADPRISPSWIEVRDGEYQVIEARAAVIRQIFKLCAEGMGVKKIANTLDAQGMKKWTRGDNWLPSTINSMLRSRAALGEYLPQSFNGGDKRKPVGDWQPAFPAIIDEVLWAQAQASLSSRRDNPGVVKHTFTNVLSGVARCGTCAGPLVLLGAPGTARNGARRLQCRSYKSGYGCNARTTYTFPIVRDAVLDHLGKLLVDHSNSAPGQAALATARAELQGMHERTDNLVDALSRNPSASMEKAVLQLEGRIAEQERLVDQLTRQAAVERSAPPSADLLLEVAKLRDGLDDDEDKRRHLNQLLKQSIDSIVLNPTNRHALAVVADGMVAMEFDAAGEVVNYANALNQLEQATYTSADGSSVSTNPAIVEQAITGGDPMRATILRRAKDRL